MEKLYIINNIGCDARTNSVVKLDEDIFEKIKAIFETINKSSYYDCMPRIYIEEYIVKDKDIDEWCKESLSEYDDKWDYSCVEECYYKTYYIGE